MSSFFLPLGSIAKFSLVSDVLGIAPTQADVVPIQGSGEGEVLETPNRRSQRCFLKHEHGAGKEIVSEVSKCKVHLRW